MRLEEYVQHLIAGEDRECLRAAKALALDLPGLHDLYVDLIQASQYRVGELWEQGKISVAIEHLATAINTHVAAACYEPLARVSAGGPPAMVTCTPDELHELGPRLLADLLECDGWNVAFFGSSMPLRDLVDAVQRRRPRFVGISVALVNHLGSVHKTIAAIRDALRAECPPIVVGGSAFREDPGLWKQLGADLYAADASSAVTMLHGLQTNNA